MNQENFDLSMNIKLTLNPHIIYYTKEENLICSFFLKTFLNIPHTNKLEDIKDKRVLLLDIPSEKVDIDDSIYIKCQRL